MTTMYKKSYEAPNTLVLTLKTQHQLLAGSEQEVNRVETEQAVGLQYGGEGTDIEARGRENVWED